MKKILIGFLAIFALHTQAQVLKPVKVDSLITVSLPAEFLKRDTLGQQIYSGTGALGYIMVIKAPNPPGKPLQKEKDLNKVFKEYIKKVQSSTGNQGSITHDHDTIINNLEVRDFVLRTDDQQGVQIRRFRLLYTRPATYTFQYVYPEAREDIAKKEGDAFFASIKHSQALEGPDQYAMFGRFTGMHKALKIALISGAVLLLVLAYIFIRRRKRMAV